MRENALRIWPDQRIVVIREDRGRNVVYCAVSDADRKMKSAFGVAAPAVSDLSDSGREALLSACTQMQKNRDEVFGGRHVFFTEDPGIDVAYCLVASPANRVPGSLIQRSRSYFAYTSELLFMSYYGEPSDMRL
jgi:hypothetical protein